jgi:copper resistance protein C
MQRMQNVSLRALAVAALVFTPVVASAAILHLRLLRSAPGVNQKLAASPTQVRLWFSQRPELTVTSIKIRTGTGAAAVERALAPLSQSAAANAPITASVGAVLTDGHYEVVWRTMARDGHVLNGVVPFDVSGTPAAR